MRRPVVAGLVTPRLRIPYRLCRSRTFPRACLDMTTLAEAGTDQRVQHTTP